jgi:uncharacterized protein YbcC (UPF0753/DUF2309 family)
MSQQTGLTMAGWAVIAATLLVIAVGVGRTLARLQGPGTCICGHAEQAHEHYRSGTDCGSCPCVRFRRASGRLS